MGAPKRLIGWVREQPCKECGGTVEAYLESDYDLFEGKPARVRWWRCRGECRSVALQKIGEVRP